LVEREDFIKSAVLQSNGSPSTAYTFKDFLASLDLAVTQLPVDKAFFVGQGSPKLLGAEYGLVSIAAFLSNAMEEGIKIDSCAEWNTDSLFDSLSERFPLSNACGQYGREYQDEVCSELEPYHCPATTAEVTAIDGNIEKNVPPFTCRVRTIDDGAEIFPGYYDSVEGVVIQSAYANTLGRTDVEGCCWWGRGVMLTRGRCTIGKLDKYLGIGAVERGVNVYPSINFCSEPEVICTHERTNELRWVLGMLEWSDRVQSYADLNTGWNYIDALKQYVDNGMDDDDQFINAVINIVTRNCHDDSCLDQWRLDNENNVVETKRQDNFHKIIREVYNLPLTNQPTARPSVPPTQLPTRAPSPSPTQLPTAYTHLQTNRPTRKGRGGNNPKVTVLAPNSQKMLLSCNFFGACTVMLAVVLSL